MKTSKYSTAPPKDLPTRLEIKNRWIYYGSVFDRYFYEYLGAFSLFNLNIFMDTISNQNNFDFSSVEREFYLGVFTFALYFGSTVGSLSTGFLTQYNTRVVFALMRIESAASITLFTYLDLRVMIAARFLMGFFYDAARSVAVWSMYEILLPRHHQRVLTLYFTAVAFSYFQLLASLFLR